MVSDNRQFDFELDDFIVTEEELEHAGTIFARPKCYKDVWPAVQQQGSALWLVGPEGIGKRTLALALARELRSQPTNAMVYRIPRSLSWSRLFALMSQEPSDLEWQASRWLSVELYNEILETIEELPYFESDVALLDVFVEPSISAWRPFVPQAKTIQERVRGTVAFLVRQRNEHSNGLEVFLRAIAGSGSSEWAIGAKCRQQADRIAAAFSASAPGEEVGRRDILILPDALGLVQLERENLDEELTFLERLAKRHIVIATSSDEVYKKAQPIALASMLRQRSASLALTDYKKEIKLEMLEKHLKAAHDDGRITSRQHQWALRNLLGRAKAVSETGSESDIELIDSAFGKKLAAWLPVDIYRFVYINLANATGPTQVRDLAMQDADIDRRIRDWFMELDDSTRAFVLTLTLMASQPSRRIWEIHKELVERLRKLDADLALPPLGLLRRRSAPYVTENGVFDFVNGQVHKAVLKEIAQDYREYVTESLDFFYEHSLRPTEGVPENSVGSEFPFFFGEIGKHGLADIEPILLSWGSHDKIGVRTAVGVTLSYVAADPTNLPDVLALLGDWLDADLGSSDDSPSTRLHWSVGAALWRVINTETDARQLRQALRLLARLANDPSTHAASSAAYALHMMVRYVRVPLAQVRPILNDLARRKDIDARHIVWTIDEAASQAAQNGAEPIQLLESWLQSGNMQRHEVAYSTLLTGTKLPRSERERLLRTALANDTERASLTAALFQALKDKEAGKGRDSTEAKTLFETIVAKAIDDPAWQNAALILDDLQKRENDFNRGRAADQQESHVCSEMYEGWLQSGVGNLYRVAVYASWIGRNIDPAVATSRLAHVASNQPDLFEGTLRRARDKSEFDRIEAILTMLLSQHPVAFLSVLAYEIRTGTRVVNVRESLKPIKWDKDLEAACSRALRAGFSIEPPDDAYTVAREWLGYQEGALPWIVIRIMFGDARLLSSPASADLMQMAFKKPSMLVNALRLCARQRDESARQSCREILKQIASPGGGWRGLLIDAFVHELREGRVTRTELKGMLAKLLPGDYISLLADIDKARMQSEWKSGTVRGTLDALWDWLRHQLTGK